jgi:2-iminobutanoate/2-iminopropanoate deaminase
MSARNLVLLAVTLILLGCQTSAPAPSTAPRYLASPQAAIRSLPFSEAVQVGDLLYLSGQIGTAPGKLELVAGGIVPEARQALENIKTVLERHGSSLSNVVKCAVFLTDIKEWPAFNEVYRQYFTRNLPARSALGANGLAMGARVEVECIAYVPSPKP